MELQWPLIIFTTLLAWAAGLFASQCALALKSEGTQAQMPALVGSFALLVVGGVAVFFHLEHWERIFNGFGHLTSGITQELIAIVVLVAVMVVYFVFLRRQGGTVPVWLAVVGIAVSVVMVAVMAHSYLMAARPAWDSVVWVGYVIGNACVLGPATLAVIDEVVSKGGGKSKAAGLLAVIGSVVNGVMALAYTFVMNGAAGSVDSVEFFFDPTEPNRAIIDVAALSPFGGDCLLLTAIGALAIGAVLPIACTLIGRKQGKWILWGSGAAACALVGAVCMRVVFYLMGFSAFALF